MKKTFLVFACFFAFGLSVAAQTVQRLDFAKKIAEATPPELPQTPVPDRKGTDARDRGLRSKVKSLIEYRVDADDPRKARKLSTQSFYNEGGNLTKTVSADDDGYPGFVNVFGYIDNMRVGRSDPVAYAEGEKPPPDKKTLSNAIVVGIGPGKPRDERYLTRYEYSYDAMGRLIEERNYENNGELAYRTTYRYSGEDPAKERLQLDYGPDGTELRTRDILYPSGDIKERDMYDDGKISDREIHQYTGDDRGNWIVDKVFEPHTAHGRQVLKPLWTMYRTITYYPDAEWSWWRDHVRGQKRLKESIRQYERKRRKR